MALTPVSVYFVVITFLDIVVRSQMSSNSNSHSFFPSNDDVRYLVDNIPVSMHKDFSSSSVRGILRRHGGQNIHSIKLIGSQPFNEYQVDPLGDNLCLDSSPLQLVKGMPAVGDESIFSSKVYLKFHPPVLDFKERFLGVPHHEKVTIINTSRNKTVHMSSISGNTVQFHSSFFQDKVIPPLGNTSFNVVFLGRGEGDIESYLFIHTSEGSFKYQVKGESVSSPYRLRPLSGIKLPLNASYSPLILMHNPHDTPLQLVEVYSSGGDFHLELPSGELEGPKHLWQIPAFLTKPVIRLRFHASSQKNHTAYIRLKVDKSGEVLVVPVEVEVGAVSGLYSPDDLIDFGIGGTEDAPKQMKLYLQNSWKKPIRVQNVISTPVSRALKIDFQPIKVSPDAKRPVQVAVLTFDWKAAYESGLSSGRVIIKSNHSGQKLVMAYKAIVLAGGFAFNHSETSFHSDQSDIQPRSVTLMNNYKVPVAVTNVTLLPSSMPYFEVNGFTPIIIMPGEKRSLLRLSVKNGSLPSNIKLESAIEVSSNASTISVPLLCYNGKLTKVISSDANETQLHLGTVGSGGLEVIHFALVNDNPVPVKVLDWGVNVTGASVNIVMTNKGNSSSATLSVMTAHYYNISLEESVLEPGHYFLLQASIPTGSDPGMKNCEVWVSTQYESIITPVYMRVEHGSLKVITNPVIFQDCFPSAICSAEVRVESHFTVGMAVTGVSSVPHQSRLGFVPVSPPLIPPGGSTLLGHITWDMSGLETYLSPNVSASGGHRWIDTLELPAHTREWDLSLLTARYERYLNISAQLVELSLRLDTTEVRNLGFRAKIRPAWPSLASIPSRTINFPLTQVGNVSYKHLQIVNPASKQPVIVQLVFDPSYPLASGLVHELPSSLRPPFNSCCESTHKENGNVFHLSLESELGLPPGVEPHEKSLAFLLMPLSNVSITIGFKPDFADISSSILMIRNNLTILEIVQLVGTGAYAQFKFGNRKPGSSLPLLFELTEKHLKDCDKDPSSRQYIPNLTVKRSFTAKNIGALPLNILGFTINGHPCQGYGFRVLDCHPFHLPANSSKKIEIAFTPDFTLSRVTRLLSILTSDTSANYTLVATLPPYLLSTCSAVLSRPAWEPLVYYCAVSFMVFLLICVLAAAYFESNRILRNAIVALSKDSCVQPVLDLRLVGSEVSASFNGGSRLESPFKFSWAIPHSGQEIFSDKIRGSDDCSSLTPYNNKQAVISNGVYSNNKKKNDRSLCKAANDVSENQNADKAWEHNNNRPPGSSQVNKSLKTSGMCITTEPYTPLTNIKAREISSIGKGGELNGKSKGDNFSKGMEPSAKKAKKKNSSSGNDDPKKRNLEEFTPKNTEENDSSSTSESSSNDDGDGEVESMFFRSVRHHLQNKANRNRQMKPLENSPCRAVKPRKSLEKGSSSSVENECEAEDDDFLDNGTIVKNNRRSSSLKSTKRGLNNKPKNELPPSRPKPSNGERGKPLLRKEKSLVSKKRPDKTEKNSSLLKSGAPVVLNERSSPLPPPPSVWAASFSDVVARSDSSYSSVLAPRNNKPPIPPKSITSSTVGSQVQRSETGLISPAKEKDMILTYAEVLLGKNVPSSTSTTEGNDLAVENKPVKKCKRRRSKKRGKRRETNTSYAASNTKEFISDWKPDFQDSPENSSVQTSSQPPQPVQIAGPVGAKRPVNSIWSNWPQFTDSLQHPPSPTPSSANSLFTDCSQQIGSGGYEGNWADHNLIKILHDQQTQQQNPSPVDNQFDVRPTFTDITWPVVTSVWEPLYTPSSAVESPPPVWGSDVWGPPTPPTPPPPENNSLLCTHSMEYDPFRSLSNIWSQHSPNIWKTPPSD